ncbi:MAG: hypothetical protein RR571_05690 [Anaerorhabdus sp.]
MNENIIIKRIKELIHEELISYDTVLKVKFKVFEDGDDEIEFFKMVNDEVESPYEYFRAGLLVEYLENEKKPTLIN